ncbi:type II secretion system F family protein [Apilactobacillus ozensis]|uniref:Bacterial type II secretion system protein F domain protein n=2 Tax=Apilactobacillus ozensis TaxID=866801 RepID=A0A0R2AMK5_9LACO|nr:type II secretion system F family protein [Apilactobacillus ozensis]KRM68401.1 bacterial type II secretion system protein F domain protein [Apilactobacillus ozensis DSM 23829 = JCM 17196]MCK8607669.1 type II secretion system F family protein [Apilactobacillus ozensis]
MIKQFCNKQMKLVDQSNLFNRLNELISVGFSIKDSITFLCNTTNSSKLSLAEKRLSEGHSFSYSVKSLINHNFYNQLLISENNGTLNNSLKGLGTFTQVIDTYNKKIKNILIYPAFLILMLFAVVLLISNVIMPQMSEMDSYLVSPMMSLYVIIGIAVILLGGFLVIYKCMHNLSPITRVKIFTKVPLFGKVYSYYLSYYLSINLFLFLNSGLDIQKVINVVGKFDENTVIYQLSSLLNQHLNSGQSYKSFIEKYNFIPKEYTIFITQGLPKLELANHFLAFSNVSFTNMDKRINRLINAIQPLIFLIIGIVIVITYMSILLPVYQSMKGI